MPRKRSRQLSEDNPELLNRVAQANGRLKAGKIGLVIEVRANRFVLRGTLPPKPGSNRGPHQQRLRTGILANLGNLPSVERLARRVAVEVAEGKFEWPQEEQEGQGADPAEPLTARDLIERVERHYWATHDRNPKSEKTFAKDYLRAFRELPSDQAFTPEAVKAAIETTAPNSRLRTRFIMAFAVLCRAADINIDLSAYSSRRGKTAIDPRTLPSDQEILRWWRVLNDRDPRWAYLYALMACYGLRPGEVWFADKTSLSPDYPLLSITAGKTGARSGILCLYPEWFETMEIADGQPPPITRNQDPGTPISRYFKATGVPFHPYDLRHSWAGRAALFGIDTGSAALQMGHSIKIHLDFYSHWYGERHQRQVWELLIGRADRPKAPR